MSPLFAILLSLLCTVVACERQPEKTDAQRNARIAPPAAERSPEQVVAELGRRMQRVPITAPVDAARDAIRREYAGLVDPQLLELWANAPADAPGRAVSSPWPDRIEVDPASIVADEATVAGHVVEMTSTGEARRIPVRARLRRSNGSWVITALEMSDDAAREQREPPAVSDAEAAVAVIRDYYRAISAGDYHRAYEYWGGSGPPGQSLQSFVAGFRDTASANVETGTPSRVEPAAGSRYVEVPVRIVATSKDGTSTRYEGTYTLRRSVIEGASEPERAWRLYRASIRKGQD